MVFSSNIFIFLFFPIVISCYFLVGFFLRGNKKQIAKNFILVVASLIFYAWGEVQYFFLLLLSILINYFFGIFIEKFHNNYKKILLTVAIFSNLSLLGYFKYYNFFIDNFNRYFDLSISNEKISLPIGISFFTFHAISYLVDIFRKKSLAQRNIINLTLYISFFPQLVAGPIVRYNFIEKYLTKRKENLYFFSYGIRRFIIGFAKKVLIANSIGKIADAIFLLPTNEISTSMSWIGIGCYTLQIYFDFSGYSDMAIGLARMFGFRFPENFNYPYISLSIKEFWRRWHISLSSWFRDYVYIPLGGNKTSQLQQYFNLILVFFLCGLWHGSSWNFIVWGLFHGLFLILERLSFLQIIGRFTPNFIKFIYTILVVTIGWVFFRSSNLEYAFKYLEIMLLGQNISVVNYEIEALLKSHFLLTSLIISMFCISPIFQSLYLKIIRKNNNFIIFGDLFLIIIFLFSLLKLSAMTHNPFLYFQF